MSYNILLAKTPTVEVPRPAYEFRGSHVVFLASLVEVLAGAFIPAVVLALIALMASNWEEKRKTENSF